MMIQFDATGVFKDAYGYTYFKRMIRFRDENGDQQVGGIHLDKSTDRIFCVQLFEEVGKVATQEENVVTTGTQYAPTGTQYAPTDNFTWVEAGKDDSRDLWVWEPNYDQNG